MPDPIAFLDTNVILRHVLADHPAHSPAATSLIRQIEQKLVAVRITDTVVFEAAYTLEKHYRVPRRDIQAALEPLLGLPGIILPGKRHYHQVFTMWTTNAGLSFADCFHLVSARQLKRAAIFSFDRRLRSVDGVTLIEPGATD